MPQSLHLMKLSSMSDENLHATNHLLATRERTLLKEIIDHLRETERRRLFAKYGYSSLFEYVTRELKCCAGSAQIRIDAMRFAVDVPEVQEKLACGEVSLSTVATLQKFVRNEKKYKSEIYTRDQKKELFSMAVGKSRRETEAELARISPQSVPRREEIRPINASENKMTLIITDELFKKIERLKQVLPEGHGNTIADIIDRSVSIALRKFDPLLKREIKECKKPLLLSQEKKRSQTKEDDRVDSQSQLGSDPQQQLQSQPGPVSQSQSHSKSRTQSRSQPQPQQPPLESNPQPQPETESPTPSNETRSKKRPYIPISIIKELHLTNQSCCSFISPTTGKRCNETHSLQIEHIVPFAKGGSSNRTNLTLLCPAHQRVRAIEEYGEIKMHRYFTLV